ncbi:MAG TPA: pyridoxamine 5'-phosphate oxidase family protein [Flavisolibacter sp.]|nr:pyridoxamine 5'-phosphate oxidase family protein [Flavisolibacter sp.]
MIGTMEINKIEEVLKTQIDGHLACHADDRTYLTPVSYAYDGHDVYVHSFEGLKISMMRKNPKVCFQVDHRVNMANWESIITWGLYEEILDKEERIKALQILANRKLPIISSSTTHLTENWPFYSGDLNNIKGIVFRIILTEKTGRFEGNIASGQN